MDKLKTVKTLIQPDTASDELLNVLLEQAAEIVLTRRYPFGYPSDVVVPERYALTQCQIAVELFSRMGAEGQTGHSENGISRSWEAGDVSPALLSRITPLCGSVEVVSGK